MFSSIQNREVVRQRVAQWLVEGIAPRRLALTLALGFVLGCIPVVGIPTALCAMVALAFRLNQPAIQAANYLAMPFQVALIVPFVRLGSKLTPAVEPTGLDLAVLARSPFQLITHSSSQLLSQLGLMAGQALLAWLVVAVPLVLLLTATLTGVLRRVPALAAAEKSGC
jgi:hypothetical protein